MKVLVTGAAGQLATDLTPRLAAESMDVEALASSELDVTDAGSVMEAVRRIQPATIVNCAAYTKVDRAEEEREAAFSVNRDGAANLAVAANEIGAALVHVSTDFVFDGTKTTPYTEADPVAPLGVYGASKLAGEEEIKKGTDDHVIVRAAWLYGSAGTNFVKTILRLAAQRDEISVVRDQVGTPTWTADLALALVAVVKRIGNRTDAPYGLYHYSPTGSASWYEFALEIVERAASLGLELKCSSVVPITTFEYPTPAARPAYSVLDHAKFEGTFGVDIPDWKSSLEKMLSEVTDLGGVRGRGK